MHAVAALQKADNALRNALMEAMKSRIDPPTDDAVVALLQSARQCTESALRLMGWQEEVK